MRERTPFVCHTFCTQRAFFWVCLYNSHEIRYRLFRIKVCMIASFARIRCAVVCKKKHQLHSRAIESPAVSHAVRSRAGRCKHHCIKRLSLSFNFNAFLRNEGLLLIVLRTTGLRAWRGVADRFRCAGAGEASGSVIADAWATGASVGSTAVAVSGSSVCVSGAGGSSDLRGAKSRAVPKMLSASGSWVSGCGRSPKFFFDALLSSSVGMGSGSATTGLLGTEIKTPCE
jgi:hypothetical protein